MQVVLCFVATKAECNLVDFVNKQ